MRIRTSGAGVSAECTFKVVQNCALAEGGVYVLKLVVKLCVKVPCLVSRYTTKERHCGNKGNFLIIIRCVHLLRFTLLLKIIPPAAGRKLNISVKKSKSHP